MEPGREATPDVRRYRSRTCGCSEAGGASRTTHLGDTKCCRNSGLDRCSETRDTGRRGWAQGSWPSVRPASDAELHLQTCNDSGVLVDQCLRPGIGLRFRHQVKLRLVRVW